MRWRVEDGDAAFNGRCESCKKHIQTIEGKAGPVLGGCRLGGAGLGAVGISRVRQGEDETLLSDK